LGRFAAPPLYGHLQCKVLSAKGQVEWRVGSEEWLLTRSTCALAAI
jgi:hypothetical protein